MVDLKDYIHIKEASSLLGVSPVTLRNWDQRGKLKPVRHPINGYRLYKKSDINNLLESMLKSMASEEHY
jgi:DNA-binding transcriptional MerR regulator